MDQYGAVASNRRNITAAYEIDNDWRQACLDDVPADTPDDWLAKLFRSADARREIAQALNGENVGETGEKV